jgi:hypothetical protein
MTRSSIGSWPVAGQHRGGPPSNLIALNLAVGTLKTQGKRKATLLDTKLETHYFVAQNGVYLTQILLLRSKTL